MRLRGAACVAVVAAVAACADVAPGSPLPVPTLTITYAIGPGFCPLAGGEDVTFRIEPFEAEPIVLVTRRGDVLRVMWPPGFVAGTPDDPVVRDPTGRIVARDGQRVAKPAAGFPELPGGWPICFGGDTIWVQDHPMD
jgi:hypothetical protein